MISSYLLLPFFFQCTAAFTFHDERKYKPNHNKLLISSLPVNEDNGSDTFGATSPRMPLTFDQMVNQVSDASREAYSKGFKRQIVRVLLPRDVTSGNLGVYFEGDPDIQKTISSQESIVLVPPDESWQGGIMQLYRSAVPTCKAILQGLSDDRGGVPPRIIEDRSVDESGVDGCGMLMTQNSLPADDISCFVQPTQEVIRPIEEISNQAGERLVMLVNPQWRNIDDALDTASKNGGIFGSFASFLGGKGDVLKRLKDLNYENVYTLEGYVCKGGNIRLMKRLDTDWLVFAETDSLTDFIQVGSSQNRPSYQECEKMLEDKGISVKYARDIGLAPKLK